ncbi:hypothetical protein [Kribbella ginsengisoli]|uniref:SLATT domain-containing protein n=1 Tax=Kribbella ginsengisoli TaxID=363865 RepID=A0ABP6WCV0_9ACTN
MTTRVEDLRDETPSRLTLVAGDDGVTYEWSDRERSGGGRVRPGETVEVLLASAPADLDPVSQAATEASASLIKDAADAARVTQKRLGQAFNSYLWMLWLLFGIGVLAVAAAIVRGLTADSTAAVATTGIFAGLSATSFVASFLLRPTGRMADAGPRAAWAQAVVTTFWTKLGYMNDPEEALQQLDQAAASMQKAMISYLNSSDASQQAWAAELEGRESTEWKEARNAQESSQHPRHEARART